MARYRIEGGRRGWSAWKITLAVFLVVLLLGARSIASYAIEIAWWKELGQFRTWLSMLYYSVAPVTVATLLAFAVLWLAHARALHFAGTSLRENRLYSRITALGLLLLGYLISAACIDTWTVVRFAGSRGLPAAATAWHDAIFQKPLSFYLFDLPFYLLLRSYVLALAIFCILIFWVAARAWQLRYRIGELRDSRKFGASGFPEIEPNFFRLEGGLESRFLRGAGVVLLLAFAVRFFLERYEMVYNEHGSFLVGVDYVDQYFGLPLQWLLIFACLAAAVLVWLGRWLLAASMAGALVIAFVVPALVGTLYVKPNEISLERPYIDTHIHATRSAYGLERHVREVEFQAEPDAPINVAENRGTLDNVRLWDWRAFHDTVSQIQALRPYYVFHDTDVDRYTIDGQYRQVLVAPRELDISQLSGARANWINPAFIYTHGYGLVMAPVSQITPDGLPVLLIDNAPAVVHTPSLKLTRPEIYYGEVTHEPVFVNTAQEEFNYPSGEQNVRARYEGKGGFPISSFFMRLAATIYEAEPNILLTDYLTPNSRMMIRRRVRERLEELAGFLEWDRDPYLVLTDAGRLVWIVDGYTTSEAHPYSRAVVDGDIGSMNYIRNAVKATVDAYDGETHMYIFAPDDPIIGAYRNLFPDLFLPASAMPADLRRHARYPETLFRIQAEIYRTYHMLDPQSFYNKEDLWDLARHATAQAGGAEPVEPTYVMAALPGEQKVEFLLMTPFTPRTKDNLIGLMVARCDGDQLGDMVVLMLSKQKLIFGPMQIAARINQDGTISKDLTLWNQQGSQVLRGQTLVLPVGNTFLYVDPIYIQATEARMPQLKKVVLAVGERLIYTDTYDEALAQLSAGAQQLVQQAQAGASGAPAASGGQPPGMPAGTSSDARLSAIREHLQRYRALAAQGRWSEAGKELEAIEAEANRK
ncbi:MAG TPA: UPF0182 family protein [Bryobacteraceae bacterium]|nr:UPF0182 family protein [Bryobacteraceae bacterium]